MNLDTNDLIDMRNRKEVTMADASTVPDICSDCHQPIGPTSKRLVLSTGIYHAGTCGPDSMSDTEIDRANAAERVEWRMEKIEELETVHRHLTETQDDLAEAFNALAEQEHMIADLRRQLAEARAISAEAVKVLKDIVYDLPMYCIDTFNENNARAVIAKAELNMTAPVQVAHDECGGAVAAIHYSIAILFAVAAMIVLFVTSPRCNADSPQGPTIGSVIKIGGCYG